MMRALWLLLGLAEGPVLAGHVLDNRDLVAGQAVYAENCASCHGANLEGQPDWRTARADGTLPAPPHDMTGHTWHHDSQLLFDYTKFGGKAVLEARGVVGFNSGMPAFGDTLSDAQILDVLGYIRSTWPDRAREAQASRDPAH